MQRHKVIYSEGSQKENCCWRPPKLSQLYFLPFFSFVHGWQGVANTGIRLPLWVSRPCRHSSHQSVTLGTLFICLLESHGSGVKYWQFLPCGIVIRNPCLPTAKILKVLGIYFELISLNALLSVFDIQKRDAYAAEAQFLKNNFFRQK